MALRFPPRIRRLGAAFGRVGVARVVVGAWLALHGFVAVAAPIADAMVGHAESVVAHWEDAQDTSCPPLHDPATCQVCQVAAGAIVGGDLEQGASRPFERSIAVPVAAALVVPSDPLEGRPHPRGPPQA